MTSILDFVRELGDYIKEIVKDENLVCTTGTAGIVPSVFLFSLPEKKNSDQNAFPYILLELSSATPKPKVGLHLVVSVTVGVFNPEEPEIGLMDTLQVSERIMQKLAEVDCIAKKGVLADGEPLKLITPEDGLRPPYFYSAVITQWIIPQMTSTRRI